MANRMSRQKLNIGVLILVGWLLFSPAWAVKFPDIGKLPASFQGELPGAGNPIIWHLDLFPEGRYQLSLMYAGRPETKRFDDIGRWVVDSSGRIVLRDGRDAPVFLMPEASGAFLRKLDIHGRSIHSDHNDRLVRLPEFRPIEPQLRLNGMFTYLADAAVITLCADGRQLPVAMEKDYLTLERAYLQADISPGQPVLVCVDGLITQRPSMEESQPPRPTMVVERFIDLRSHKTCASPPADLRLCGPGPVSAAAAGSHLGFRAAARGQTFRSVPAKSEAIPRTGRCQRSCRTAGTLKNCWVPMPSIPIIRTWPMRFSAPGRSNPGAGGLKKYFPPAAKQTRRLPKSMWTGMISGWNSDFLRSIWLLLREKQKTEKTTSRIGRRERIRTAPEGW